MLACKSVAYVVAKTHVGGKKNDPMTPHDAFEHILKRGFMCNYCMKHAAIIVQLLQSVAECCMQ